MRPRTLRAVAALFALAVIGAAAALRPDRAERTGVDVVLVIGCTVRADQSGPWGGPPGLTPALESLAARGTAFDQALVHAPWTRPSIASLVTGLYPAQAGQVDLGPGRSDRALPPSLDTLAELLVGAGWHAEGFTANPNLNAVFGFDQGFSAYHEYSGLWRKVGVVKVDGSDVVQDALRRVDHHDRHGDGQPLYLQLVLADTHLPWTGTQEEADAEEGPTDRVRSYRAMMRRFDAAVGQLEAGLRARGRGDDDLLFVVIGDHGEGLHWPEHHGNAHGRGLFPSSVRVPWVVTGPRVAPGHAVSGLAAGVDLVPTVLGLLDLPPLDDPPGLDLSAHSRGEAAEVERETLFTGTWFQELDRAALYRPDGWCQVDHAPERTRAVNAKRPVKSQGYPVFVTGCFASDDADAEQALRSALDEAEVRRWRALMADWSGAAPVVEAQVSADVDAQLEALGYVDGE